MSAQAAAMTAAEADRFLEGWRAGNRAAVFVLRTIEGEYDRPGTRMLLAEVGRRVASVTAPSLAVPLPRADRLEAAIRSALKLAGEDLTPEALHLLRDALA